MSYARLNLGLMVLAAGLFIFSLLVGPAGLGPVDSLRGLVAGGD